MPKSDLDALVEAGGRDGVARVSAKRRLLGGNRYHGFEASFSQCFGMKEMYHYLNVPFLELKVSMMLAPAACHSHCHHRSRRQPIARAFRCCLWQTSWLQHVKSWGLCETR